MVITQENEIIPTIPPIFMGYNGIYTNKMWINGIKKKEPFYDSMGIQWDSTNNMIWLGPETGGSRFIATFLWRG